MKAEALATEACPEDVEQSELKAERQARLPVDAKTGLPIQPCAQPGYYSEYDVLGQQEFWDKTTRDVVLKRMNEVPVIKFFTIDEASLAEAIFDRLIPQDDRDDLHRIPVVNLVDHRLHAKLFDGYQYESMPPHDAAYRLGLVAIQKMAKQNFGRKFVVLSIREQEELLVSLRDGKPRRGAERIWNRMSAKHFWTLLIQDAIESYYAHPWAWNEIGYGGPAYPRGYMRLEHGRPEPWEAKERRYEWKAPRDSISDSYTTSLEVLPGAAPGQMGTH